MDTPATIAYHSPEIVESFDAIDILGSAEGFEVYIVGTGSQIATISLIA